MLFKLTVHTRKAFQLLVAVVYIAFFTVQLFFNFDITWLNQSKQSNSIFYQQHTLLSSKDNSFSKKNDEENNAKPRLNKRFQPRSIEFIPVQSIDASIAFILMDHEFNSYQSIQISSFVQHYSLRGPPAISLSV